MVSPHLLVDGIIGTILAFNKIKRWINTITCGLANIKRLTFTIRPHLETSIFASYYRQQTMLLIYIWRQIQPEMQDLVVK